MRNDYSWREPYWQRAYEQLGADERAGEVVEALKKFYSLYADELVEWVAELYDPGEGAFYCTHSGKYNDGFLPHTETVSQICQFMESSGMISHLGGDYRNAFPEDMKRAIARFLKRQQLPNGYFYNVAKTQEEFDKHIPARSRHLQVATVFLRELGYTPTYDTPNGIKGDGLDIYGNPVSDYKAAEVSEAKAEEPKPEKKAVSVNYPPYLENRDTFLAYLEERIAPKITVSPYGVGNELNAMFREVKARSDALVAEGVDYSLADTLIDWLNERIDDETGYWSKKTTFEGTNGFFKIISIYNVWGIPYPEPVKAATSILNGILGDEPSTKNILELSNLWNALSYVKHNVTNFHSEEKRNETLELIKNIMKERGYDAITNTYKKYSAYRMPDGAFAHRTDHCLQYHQGDIAVGLGLREGAMDACGFGTINSIVGAYGIKRIPIYSEREWKIFEKVLLAQKPVVKNTKPLR